MHQPNFYCYANPMDLASKRVVVMGLGRFGGGVGVTRFLVKQGADVLVTDADPPEKLADSVAALEGLPIEYRLGEHNVSDFTTADLIVANPAVKPDNRFLRAAEAADIPITTEIRLLVERLPNRRRTIGVTGTAGKSTVAAMIAHVLRKAGEQENRKTGKVWLGGNIGGSLLESLDEIGEQDWVVLELSSFMLHHLNENRHFPGWSPGIAVITNISPNHLDWHGTFDEYLAAKQVILEFEQSKDSHPVLGPGVHEQLTAPKHGCIAVRAPTRGRYKLKLPGQHNQTNARIALGVVSHAIGVHPKLLLPFLSDFMGLPHRLQYVGEHFGVWIFNDSKSTTPEASLLAIDSFRPGTVHIILGGADKGSDLKPLAWVAAQRCAGVYTIGHTGPTLAGFACASPGTAHVVECGTLERAVDEALERAERDHVVLLSPGCASWDQFTNYEQRGERFIELVRQKKKPTA